MHLHGLLVHQDGDSVVCRSKGRSNGFHCATSDITRLYGTYHYAVLVLPNDLLCKVLPRG